MELFEGLLAGIFSVKTLLVVMMFVMVLMLYYMYRVSRFRRRLQKQYNDWKTAEYNGVEPPPFDIEEWNPKW